MKMTIFITLFTGLLLLTVTSTVVAGQDDLIVAPQAQARPVDELFFDNPTFFRERAQAPYSDEMFLSATALRILRHTVGARADIHAKDLLHAQDELKQAIMLLDIIQAMDPADRIRGHIWVAQKRLSYESNDIIIRDLNALYESVGGKEGLTEENVVAAHIGKARKLLVAGNRPGASEELRLADEALADTEIDLPVKYTKRYIEEAQAFIAKKKLGKADAALKSAEDGIRFLSILDYMPTERAARSLSRAHRNYLALKFDAARADLKEGKAFLEKAAQTEDEKTRAEIGKLTKDIESVEAKAGTWSQDVSQEIRSLYLRAKKLTVKAASTFKAKKTKAGTNSG